tara:strand:+ start:165 stop:485 length:321 start_codon:yes stop_codon:yes gene_type:complete
MIGKIVTLSLLTIFIIAFMIRSPSAYEIPCVGKEESQIFEPSELVRGYGIREGALVKLSVSSEGYWLLTLSPPELEGAVCIVFMGTDWKFVTPKDTKEEVKHGRSN